ncbi:hypothetical protein BDZ97DRAFT_1911538 [Flammula alnicola]|nr:hypothetical protein BDZ97DRAFT_1911538 [Flammula alnicola]
MSAFSSRSSTLVQIPTLGEGTFTAHEKEAASEILGWTLCVHSQGWIYFYNSSLKVVTDQDIRQPKLLKMTEDLCSQYPLSELSEGMEVHIQHIHVQTQMSGSELASSFNIAINHTYCVASYNLDEVKADNSCLLGPTRLNRCRRLYWNYLWNHPVHVPAPPRALEDASDALTWFYTDNLISGARSTVPFSKSECEELSRLIGELSLAKTIFLAWLLREICSFRDAECWGQHTQRESQTIRKQRKSPVHAAYNLHPVKLAIINFIVNFIFFGIPHTYRAHVKITSEYRGRLSNVQKNWEGYIERLVREYSHFLLISTVLLSATVGFLAVPGIPEGAQVAATISTFASLGSIIVGVFSIWRHQANTKTADSFTYMHNVQHSFLGLYGHAILLSLPPTLLVWAILLFTLSVIVFLVGIGDIYRPFTDSDLGVVYLLYHLEVPAKNSKDMGSHQFTMDYTIKGWRRNPFKLQYTPQDTFHHQPQPSNTMPESTPTYIYKIVPSSTPPPSPLPDVLPVSDLDKSSRFIHLSTALQVPGTLKRFFADEDRVYILRIDYKSVESKIKWEDSKGEVAGGVGEVDMFPHLYNDLRLGKAEVESVVEWERQSGWDAAIDKAKADSWFIY